MLHPSYSDLMAVVNSDIEEGEQPVVQSRYSIVIATAKRARQIIAGSEPLVYTGSVDKPLSTAVEELYQGKVKIIGVDEAEDEDEDDFVLDYGSDVLDLSYTEDGEIKEFNEEDLDQDDETDADEDEEEYDDYED